MGKTSRAGMAYIPVFILGNVCYHTKKVIYGQNTLSHFVTQRHFLVCFILVYFQRLNLDPYICYANALPLSYIPNAL